MEASEIQALNRQLDGVEPLEIVRWAVARGGDHSLVSTNFRPLEAVVLHLATAVKPDIRVLWADHGCNLPETYRFAENCRQRLSLNIQSFVPTMTAAHWTAINGPIPAPDEVERVEAFSRIMKLEPFFRGLQTLAPKVWITGLRRVQNPRRQNLEVLEWDDQRAVLKVNPVLEWSDEQMHAYLRQHDLPDERTYYDPAKGDEKHECGLHAPLTTAAGGA